MLLAKNRSMVDPPVVDGVATMSDDGREVAPVSVIVVGLAPKDCAGMSLLVGARSSVSSGRSELTPLNDVLAAMPVAELVSSEPVPAASKARLVRGLRTVNVCPAWTLLGVTRLWVTATVYFTPSDEVLVSRQL
ncbi:hypothetical protein GCM10027047_12350 [Rhodococcus aerolatus]